MKAFPKRFDTEIIAELRGFIDPSGQSPFWEAVGKRFFQKDYYSADVLSGLGDKDFIEALMPKFPIYYNLLPYSAQMVIGEVHPETEPALKLLMKEGFRKTNEVDIFDAGPLLKAKRESLRTWQLCKSAEPTVNDSIPDKFIPAIVTNHDLNFRAVLARIEVCEDGKVCLDKDTFNALKQPKAVQYVCLK